MKDTTALDCLLRTFADCEAVLLESVWAPPAAELRADGCEHGPSDGWSAKQKQWLSFTQLTPNPPHGCKAKSEAHRGNKGRDSSWRSIST